MLRYFLSVFAGFMLLPTMVTAAPGTSCGGIVGDSVCGKSEYCAKGTGSCDPNLPGICTAIPQVCTKELRPVCGCDEKTYSNVCMAAAAGVNILHGGECKKAAMVCGGIAGVKCQKGQYCNFGAHCGVADQQGECATIPEACTQQFDPVCGCDEKSYSNACMAAAAGTSVAGKGKCEGKTKY